MAVNLMFLFKDYVEDLTSTKISCWTKTNLACSTSIVYLQVYNRTLATWENVSFNDFTDKNIDFELIGSLPLTGRNISDYKDLDKFISCRVYQEVK